ncbi:MAG TPA: TIGR01458 family HAD-type hydrolase, partial [Rhodocyclaceae bacterium]|nr:TIGR01458 family HAD-type hydrolase [Rhodocyclaceae bacterium]
VDLAGVLYVGDDAVPGAIEGLAHLRSANLPLRFLTNTTRSPRSTIIAKLKKLGFAIAEEEILTAALATKMLVVQRSLRPHYLIHPDIAYEMGPNDLAPTVVVLGDAGNHFTYDALNAAFRLLMEGLPLLVMAKNRYFQEADGLSLDMGAFVAALEFSAGVQAEVVGKPSRAYFEAALTDLGIDTSEAVMIGDDLADDIDGAQQAGIAGILVRTGKFRPQDAYDPRIKPALIADDFAAAVSAIIGEST